MLFPGLFEVEVYRSKATGVMYQIVGNVAYAVGEGRIVKSWLTAGEIRRSLNFRKVPTHG